MANDKYVKPGYKPADGMPMAQGNSVGMTKGMLNTQMGRHPIVKRMSKHPVSSLTSRKSQQGKGNS